MMNKKDETEDGIIQSNDDYYDDVVIEITNGKKVSINLDPLEWLIISTVIATVAGLTGWLV